MLPRLFRSRIRRAFAAAATALTTAILLSAGALLNITPQPAGGSTGARLPADPNAQPPSIPYLAIRLAPDTPGESDLSILEVTESGHALLSYPGGWTSDYGSNPTLGYRWHDGVMQPLNRSPAEQRPYHSMNYGYSFLLSINDSGVVVGSYSHEDTLDYYHSVSSDGVYVSTGCYWPAGESDSQPLPPPCPGLRGGYVANFITDTGTLHGRMLNRGVWPPHSFSAYITYEFGLTWSSISSTPKMQGATWPAGDASTPQITRTVTAVSPSGLHTIGRESYQFFTEAGYWSRYENRFGANNLLDGLPLAVPHTPVAINDHGRWIATRSGTSFIYWSEDRKNLAALESGAPLAINNAHDILGSDVSGHVIWKWLPDPANPPAYHYVKHKITPAIPASWALNDINGRGFTTSGLFTGKIRKTHDDLGQPLPSNQQTTAPVLFVPVEMTWEANSDNDNLSPNKSPVPAYVYDKALPAGGEMPGGGFRIFPDAKSQTDTTPRDTVKLNVKLPPTLSGRVIHARILDVDDPVPTSFDDDGAGVLVLDENDFNGIRAGHDNRGDFSGNSLIAAYFLPSNTPATSTTVDTSGNAEFLIKVSMQPGDNYRVAIALDSADKLSVLQVEDHTQPGYVEATSTAVMNGFDGILSPMLTVWRKLHIEQDTMSAVTFSGPHKNAVSGRAISLQLLAPSNPHTYTLEIEDDSEQTILNDSLNRFYDGRVFLAGHEFIVRSSDKGSPVKLILEEDSSGNLAALVTTSQQSDFVYINGTVLTYTLLDDDSRNIPNDFTLPLAAEIKLVDDYVRSKYVSSYMELDDTQPNPDRHVAFERNSNSHPFHPEGRNLNDRASFWACRLVAAWQSPIESDRDPHLGGADNEKPIEGEVGEYRIDGGIGSADAFIYMELLREYSHLSLSNPATAPEGRLIMLRQKGVVVAHELAHLPPFSFQHDDHNEGGLMAVYEFIRVDSEFTATTIRRIRNTTKWTH